MGRGRRGGAAYDKAIALVRAVPWPVPSPLSYLARVNCSVCLLRRCLPRRIESE